MSRHVTSCHARHVMSRHVTSCHVMSHHVMPRRVTSRHVASRHGTSCHVMSRHVTSRCRDISSLAALSRQRSRRSCYPASPSVMSVSAWTRWRSWFSYPSSSSDPESYQEAPDRDGRPMSAPASWGATRLPSSLPKDDFSSPQILTTSLSKKYKISISRKAAIWRKLRLNHSSQLLNSKYCNIAQQCKTANI